MVAIIPILVALAGVLAYALSSNAKIVKIGEIAFFCGLLVSLFSLAGTSIRVLS